MFYKEIFRAAEKYSFVAGGANFLQILLKAQQKLILMLLVVSFFDAHTRGRES